MVERVSLPRSLKVTLDRQPGRKPATNKGKQGRKGLIHLIGREVDKAFHEAVRQAIQDVNREIVRQLLRGHKARIGHTAKRVASPARPAHTANINSK